MRIPFFFDFITLGESMDSIYKLIGRETGLFGADIATRESILKETIAWSRFIVVGGAGSIGQAVVKEIFKRHPAALHVVDLSENNLVELVRDVRSAQRGMVL